MKTDFLSIYRHASFQYVLRFTLLIDTLIQSVFHSLQQFGKEVNRLTTAFSLQTKHLRNMFCLPNVAHKPTFQVAGGLPKPMSLT